MRGRPPVVGLEREAGQQLAPALVRLGEQALAVERQQVEGDVRDRDLLCPAADRLGPREPHPQLQRLKARMARFVEGHDLSVQDGVAAADRRRHLRELGVARRGVLAAAARDTGA